MTKVNYGPPYESDGNCLYLVTKDKHGQTRKRLCNFAPDIIEQVTKNDGVDCATSITLGGPQGNGKSRRVVVMDKFKAEIIANGGVEKQA